MEESPSITFIFFLCFTNISLNFSCYSINLIILSNKEKSRTHINLTLWYFYCIEANRTCLPSKMSEGRFPNIHRIYQQLSYHCSQGFLVTFSLILALSCPGGYFGDLHMEVLATTPNLLENAELGTRPIPPDLQKCCEVGTRIGSGESMQSPTTTVLNVLCPELDGEAE